jgi:hypothetical protein
MHHRGNECEEEGEQVNSNLKGEGETEKRK